MISNTSCSSLEPVTLVLRKSSPVVFEVTSLKLSKPILTLIFFLCQEKGQIRRNETICCYIT